MKLISTCLADKDLIELQVSIGGEVQKALTQLLHIQNEQVKQALISLGWTPPKEEQEANARLIAAESERRVEREKYQTDRWHRAACKAADSLEGWQERAAKAEAERDAAQIIVERLKAWQDGAIAQSNHWHPASPNREVARLVIQAANTAEEIFASEAALAAKGGGK